MDLPLRYSSEPEGEIAAWRRRGRRIVLCTVVAGLLLALIACALEILACDVPATKSNATGLSDNGDSGPMLTSVICSAIFAPINMFFALAVASNAFFHRCALFAPYSEFTVRDRPQKTSGIRCERLDERTMDDLHSNDQLGTTHRAGGCKRNVRRSHLRLFLAYC